MPSCFFSSATDGPVGVAGLGDVGTAGSAADFGAGSGLDPHPAANSARNSSVVAVPSLMPAWIADSCVDCTGAHKRDTRATDGLLQQFWQRAVFADEVLRAAGEVRELRRGDVEAEALVERGEDFAEMDWARQRFLGPAGR